MLRCVIVDDEDFSINALRAYIEQLPNLTIVGTYIDPHQAMNELSACGPIDILFLDVDMPLITGIELASVVRNHIGKLVFTTSHSKYAYDAFEVTADAFLLKPYSFTKFAVTISRLFPKEAEGAYDGNDYFLVKNKENDLRIVKVDFQEVVAFESLHNYVKIHLTKERHLVAYLNLKDIAVLVSGRQNFRQFHRAYIISTDHIEYIDGNTIRMSDKLSLNVGDSFRSDFQRFIEEYIITTARKK